MNARGFEPFFDAHMLQQLQREFGRLVDSDWVRERATAAASAASSAAREHASGSWYPAADVFTDDDALRVVIDVPGVDPEVIEVTIQRRCLQISAERTLASVDGVRSSRQQGRFTRRFELPDGADDSRIDAKCENGVLTVTVPLGTPPATKRKVEVKRGS